MRQRTRLTANSCFNVLARLVTVATRFVIIPFAIGVLGRGHYGVWVVVGQIFAYTRILDTGLRSAIARQVAVGLARNDYDKLNRHVNTAAGYYVIVGLLIVVLTGTISFFFPAWFDVDPELRSAARIMVLCSGLALACSVPQNAYSAVVTGFQRYDIICGSQILADLLRLALILLLLREVGVGGGLILLALASGGTALCAATLRTLAALRMCKHVRFEPWRADPSLLGGLMWFGINSLIYMMSVSVGVQLAQIVIGGLMSTAEAADFNIATMFLLAGHSFVVAFGISARVVASKYDGERNDKMLGHLLFRSTRYSGFVALAGMMILLLFSSSLLRLWIGGEYPGVEGAATLERIASTCRILTIGYGLFWLLLPAYNVVNGMGRHKLPAMLAAAAGILSMSLVALLASTENATIERVAWGVVLPIIPVWGVVMPWYCCRETRQPIGAYVWEGFAIPAMGCVPAGVVGFLLNYYYPAPTWWVLIGQLACYATVLLVIGWFLGLAADDRLHMVDSVRSILRRLG